MSDETVRVAGPSSATVDSPNPMPTKRSLLSWQRLTTPSAVLIATLGAGNALRVVNTMILTRLLSPGDFGLAGMILAVFFVVAMLTDVGFQAFIVRHERGDDPHFLNAVWTIHIGRGLLNSAAIILLSAPVANVLGKPQLAPLLAAAALTLAIDGAASPTLMTSLRRGLVRRLSVVDFGAQVVQFIVGIAASAYFHNAWAIVTSMLAGSIFKTAASYAIFPDSKRQLVFDRAIASELWKFSRVIAASSILTLLIAQVDKLVLARLFSLAEFGTYIIASNLALAPTALVHMYVSRILYPQMARAWRDDPGAIRSVYYGSRGVVFFGYLFAAGGLIGSGPLLIRILYDPRYAGAGIFLQLLAVASAMAMLTRTMQDGLVAIGRTRTTLLMNMWRVLWLAVAGPLGFLAAGPIGLVGTLATIEIPAYLYGVYVMRRIDLLSFRRELFAMAFILAGTGFGLLTEFALGTLFR